MDAPVRAGAASHPAHLSVCGLISNYRRGKQLQRSRLTGEHDCTVQAKQGCRHSLDLAAVRHARNMGIGAFFWSTFVAKQDSCNL